ncbi:hypothetical protein [Staphylothermus hellenicus]|uniref:UPF0113 domain-containing protein n=1 Tax=Staphylothermus hellenicus (strain DSM 12710 / JCM 10830 / BK20S6-10-b1 / P8) TaxID=591019 RepID=D7D8M7_STAHD|nr:hypothetical protein [Staphylothermus hellenicus]ADI32123.1 hypothetical protein Shell_1018 [Staphylothermus hellenicus DSM 12710]
MSNKHKLRISLGKLSKKYKDSLFSYVKNVLEADPVKYLGHDLYYVCLNTNCFISNGAGKYHKLTMLYKGVWIGVIINNKPYLSPEIYEEIYRDIRTYRAAIIVGEKGVKNFLYGNDILEQSIIAEYQPLDQPVAVIDHLDGKVIGVAERVVGRGKIYQNIYDLGFFLRLWG